MNNAGKTLKVLIAVDIQNCFIHGGSLAAFKTNNGSKNVFNKKKYINEKKGQGALTQAEEVLGMMMDKDIVVITRDSHPENHKSFKTMGHIFEPHCRKTKKGIKAQHPAIEMCPPMEKTSNKAANAAPIPVAMLNAPVSAPGNKTNTGMMGGASYTNVNGKSQEIVGTDPAMAYDLVAEGNEKYKSLVRKIKNCDLNVGFANEAGNQMKPIGEAVFTCDGSAMKQAGMPIFIDLRKGEKCDMDAYSAFNYHVTYGDNATDTVPCAFETSTMLLETLLSDKIKEAVGEFSKVEVDVCGLVGNICVMYTTTYGSEYAKMAAANMNAFQANYARIPGLTFGGSVPPFHFNFHGRKGTQWLRTIDGKTPYPYNPNGAYPNMDGNDPKTIIFERQMIEMQAENQGVLDNITILELNTDVNALGNAGLLNTGNVFSNHTNNLKNSGLMGVGNVFGNNTNAGNTLNKAGNFNPGNPFGNNNMEGGRRKNKTRKNCWPKRSKGGKRSTRKPKGHKAGCKCVICKRR